VGNTQGPSKLPRRLGFGTIFTFALFCANRGCSAVNASPSWISGALWFAGAAVLLVTAIWLWEHTTKWHWVIRFGLSLAVLFAVSLGAYGPVSEQYRREHPIQAAQVKVAPVSSAPPTETKTTTEPVRRSVRGNGTTTRTPGGRGDGIVGSLEQGACSAVQVGGKGNTITGPICGQQPEGLE